MAGLPRRICPACGASRRGKADGEDCTLGRATPCLDGAAVPGDDLPGKREAETEAAVIAVAARAKREKSRSASAGSKPVPSSRTTTVTVV
jgi:hypothetical protein